jgi:ABC-type uncharacterized transport system involved in gliding motility auxiliary subunit
MTKRQTAIISALAIVCFLLALLVSVRLWFRVDLTKGHAYTISKVSRELSREIPDEVRITYYVSEKLAKVHPVPGEIEDLLREYAAYSRGKIRYIQKDPGKANLAQEVQQLGIPPQQIQVTEQDQATLATVYTGILIEYLDRTDVIPVAFSLDTLEYDLTSRIRALVRGTDREVGILAGDAEKTVDNYYPMLGQSLTQSGYKTRTIAAGDEIPDTLPVLFVLGGAGELDDWALYRIDHYIAGGGKVLFAVDSVAIDMSVGLSAKVIEDKGLLAMLSGYGITVKPELVLDRTANMVQMESGGGGGFRQIQLVYYPFWFNVTDAGGNKAHPVTANFSGASVFWASPLEVTAGKDIGATDTSDTTDGDAKTDPKTTAPSDVKAEELFYSTADSWLMTSDIDVNPAATWAIQREQGTTTGKHLLAASLAGTFTSYFAGREKPTREGATDTLPDTVAAAPARIVVVGDADFASNMMQNVRGTANLDFLIKAADWLGSDDDIISIRARTTGAGRLDKITDPEARKKAFAFVRVLNLIIVPALVIAAGVAANVARKRRAGKGVTNE